MNIHVSFDDKKPGEPWLCGIWLWVFRYIVTWRDLTRLDSWKLAVFSIYMLTCVRPSLTRTTHSNISKILLHRKWDKPRWFLVKMPINVREEIFSSRPRTWYQLLGQIKIRLSDFQNIKFYAKFCEIHSLTREPLSNTDMGQNSNFICWKCKMIWSRQNYQINTPQLQMAKFAVFLILGVEGVIKVTDISLFWDEIFYTNLRPIVNCKYHIL